MLQPELSSLSLLSHYISLELKWACRRAEKQLWEDNSGLERLTWTMHLQTITSLIFLFHLLQLLITACQASSIFFVNIENRFSEFYNSRVLSFLFIASYANCHLVQRTDSPFFFFPSLSVSIGYKMEKVNKKRNLDVWVQRVGWLQEFQTGRHIRSSFMVFQSLYTTFQIVCQNFSDETGKWKKPSLLLMFLLRFMFVVKW